MWWRHLLAFGVTTTAPHTLRSYDRVTISGVNGIAQANGQFTIQVLDSTSFEVVGVSATGTYVSSGNWFMHRVYFVAIGPTSNRGANYGRELWTSDGTSVGTRMVRDINTAIDVNNPATDVVHRPRRSLWQMMETSTLLRRVRSEIASCGEPNRLPTATLTQNWSRI